MRIGKSLEDIPSSPSIIVSQDGKLATLFCVLVQLNSRKIQKTWSKRQQNVSQKSSGMMKKSNKSLPTGASSSVADCCFKGASKGMKQVGCPSVGLVEKVLHLLLCLQV